MKYKKLFIVAGLFFTLSPRARAQAVGLSGYVQPAYIWQSETPDTNTFQLLDGALAFNAVQTNSTLHILLPFSGFPGTNALMPGFSRAEAYVKFKAGGNYKITVGQFKDFHGYEHNYADELFFVMASNGSLIFLPDTLTGVMLEEKTGGWFVNLAISNPPNQGAMLKGNPFFSWRLGYETGDWQVSNSGYFGHGEGVVTSGLTKRYLIELNAQYKIGSTKLRLGALMQSIQGAANAYNFESAELIHDLNEEFSVGIRGTFYYINSDYEELGLGCQYKLTEMLTAKLEYSHAFNFFSPYNRVALGVLGKF